MGQRRHEVDTATAARVLELNTETLRRWARAVIGGQTSSSRLTYARVDLVGRYWFDRAEVLDLARSSGRGEAALGLLDQEAS